MGVVVALAVGGSTYQIVSTMIDERAHPAPGQLVDTGGHRLHLNCSGQGSPTVVLESVLANRSADWDLVQPRSRRRHVSARTTGRGSAGAMLVRDRATRGISPTSSTCSLQHREPLGALRIGGSLVRRALRAYVHRPLPGRGRGHGAGDASHPDQWAYAPAEFRATAQPSP